MLLRPLSTGIWLRSSYGAELREVGRAKGRHLVSNRYPRKHLRALLEFSRVDRLGFQEKKSKRIFREIARLGLEKH